MADMRFASRLRLRRVPWPGGRLIHSFFSFCLLFFKRLFLVLARSSSSLFQFCRLGRPHADMPTFFPGGHGLFPSFLPWRRARYAQMPMIRPPRLMLLPTSPWSRSRDLRSPRHLVCHLVCVYLQVVSSLGSSALTFFGVAIVCLSLSILFKK